MRTKVWEEAYRVLERWRRDYPNSTDEELLMAMACARIEWDASAVIRLTKEKA